MTAPLRACAALVLALGLAVPGAADDFHLGITLSAFSRDEYRAPTLDSQIHAIADTGATHVALTPRWLQSGRHTADLAAQDDQSPSDASLRHAIDRVHAAGLAVFLKPQVDLTGEGWRGEIAFDDEAGWAAWFASYQRFVLHYAQIAQQARVALFCVGVELDATRHRESDWRAVIAAVREVYRGKLTWAANWNRETDVPFWDGLDYIGVDAYYPLSRSAKPTFEQLLAGWEVPLARLRRLARDSGRPILLTEIGYRSATHAAREPWEWQSPGTPDRALQARAYRAAFERLRGEPWLAGLYWWQWRSAPPADPATDTGFTPQGKPAEQELRAAYTGWQNPTPPAPHR